MASRGPRNSFTLTLVILVALLSIPLSAQTSLPFRIIGPGYMVVRARISRAGVEMDRHLLVDLMCPASLAYHSAEALFLGIRQRQGTSVDLKIAQGGITGVPVLALRLTHLERLTKRFASELEQIPLVGILGWKAFKGWKLVIDPRAKQLNLQPPALPGDLPREEGGIPMPLILPLLMDENPPAIQARVGKEQVGRLFIATGRPRSFLLSGVVASAGYTGKPVKLLTVGKDSLVGVVPFQRTTVEQLIYRLPGPLLGGLGWNYLANYRTTLDGVNKVLILNRIKRVPFPREEQLFLLAESGGLAGLEHFLKQHPEGDFASQAAAMIFRQRRDEGAGTPAQLAQAGRQWAALLPAPERAPVLLQTAEALLDLFPLPEVTGKVITEGIAAGRVAEDKETSYRIQHLAGRFWLAKEEWRRARQHMINAVYGLLHEGPVNIDYGRALQGLGKEKRAFGAYLRALLDIKGSGPEALVKLEGLRPGRKRLGMVAEIARSLEGRILSFSLPGEPVTPPQAKPPHPLVEHFTCAEAKSSTGMGLAIEALTRKYGKRISLLAHHLHSPSPDPLAAPESLERATALRVRKLPCIYVNGKLVKEGGIKTGAATGCVELVSKAIDKARRVPRQWQLTGAATYNADKRVISGEMQMQGPAGRVQLWLVARRALYPGADRLFIHRGVARFQIYNGEVKEKITFQAKLHGIWSSLAWRLDKLELKLMEKGFSFRWKPSRPDPAELALVAFVSTPGEGGEIECLSITPQLPETTGNEKEKGKE